MFDLSNPQKRERFLVFIAGVTLCVIVMVIVPAQYRETIRLQNERDKVQKNIDDRERLVKNKDKIRSRLAAMENQALTSLSLALENESVSKYQNWLRDMVTAVGFRDVKDGGTPASSGTVKGGYKKHVFSVTGDGRLDQIAEFLCRFHHTQYLHQILSFSPQPVQNQPEIFRVTFRVEALSLPQVKSVNVPNIEEMPAMTDDDNHTLAAIRDRAILSPYTPPRPPVAAPPPPEPFDDVAFCFLTGIVEADGRPQCWIDYRTTGRKYYFFEEGSFMLQGLRCTIKKIEIDNQRILVSVNIGDELRTGYIRLGKNFEDFEEIEPLK